MTRPDIAKAEMVGPYRVIKPIGGGGSARIDLARIERAYNFEREVVLKRPLEHLRGSSAASSSLRREASLGGRLRHPNVIAVLDAGEHDGYDYLVLEYIHGSSLRAAVEARPGEVAALPLDAVISIVVGIATGLHFAHELVGADGSSLGLVHRDVSPANILLGFDGTVKLADFGIGKDTHIDTLSGSLRGTVTYMAPEQCRGHAFDRRADVFSLGVILHELITSRRLFWADNDVASLHRVLSGAVPDPRSLVPSLDPELSTIAMQALAYDARDRIPTAKHLAEALESFATKNGVLVGARRIERALLARSPASSSSNRLTDKRFSISAAVTAPRGVAEPIPTVPMPSVRVGFSTPIEEEPSLVAVIERTPDPDGEPMFSSQPLLAPPVPFAAPPVSASPPTPPLNVGLQVAPSRVRDNHGTNRRWVAILIGALVIGIVVVIFARRDSSPDFPRVSAPPTAPTAPMTSPPIAPPTDPPSPAEPAPDPSPPAAPTPAILESTPAPRRPARPRTTPRPPPEKPATELAGSGSATPDPTKARWNDQIVLPSDPGTGSGR